VLTVGYRDHRSVQNCGEGRQEDIGSDDNATMGTLAGEGAGGGGWGVEDETAAWPSRT
jgi:hypothetical protein